MGKILSTRSSEDNKVIAEIMLDYEEILQLGGHQNNIHLFSSNVNGVESRVSLRGKNDATKYFLIPKALRKQLMFNTDVKVQRIITRDKDIFIYSVDKCVVKNRTMLNAEPPLQ